MAPVVTIQSQIHVNISDKQLEPWDTYLSRFSLSVSPGLFSIL